MIAFIIKGLKRDRSRSFFPTLITTLIVAIVIFFSGFLNGVYNSLFLNTALVNSGHLKVVTNAYNDEYQLLPNDLSMINVGEILNTLNNEYENYIWTPRITFAGLLDVPNDNGETLVQSPAIGLGVDFLSKESTQFDIWELENKILVGSIPQNKNDIIISNNLSERLNLSVGKIVTFIGSTMDGGFTTYNFIVSGIFNLRMGPIDRDMMMVDIEGARFALDMENSASEILGYQKNLFFDNDETVLIKDSFNKKYNNITDPYSLVMLALRDMNQMGTMIDFSDVIIAIILGIILFVVTVLLWNMGIMSGLRRYGEIGMRIAIGETKNHIFISLVIESLIIGIVGSLIGTILGISVTTFFESHGLDYSKGLDALSSSNFPMPNIFYPKVTPSLYFLGFIPGVLATLFGTILAGRAIYKRETAQLFKELES